MGYRHLQESAYRNGTSRMHVVLFIVGVAMGFIFTSIRLNSSDPVIIHRAVTLSPEEIIYNEQLTENSTVADQLFNEVRLTCFVITPDKMVAESDNYIKPWGKRCNKMVYVSAAKDSNKTDTVNIDGKESEWKQLKNVFTHLYEKHRQDTDFFVGAYHRSFVIPENIRYMVYPYSAEQNVYFGSQFRLNTTNEPAAKEFVMSRSALEMIFEKGLHGPSNCKGSDSGAGHTELRKCLEKLSVVQGESTDAKGLERFLTLEPFDKPLPLDGPIGEATDLWFRKHLFTETLTHNKSCSDTPVALSNLDVDQLVGVDCLINTIQPYGIVDQFSNLPPKLTDLQFEALPLFTV